MSGTGRTVIAIGLVAAMVVALVVVVLSGDGDGDPVATSPSTTSTTTTAPSTSTTLPPSTTTTAHDPDARLSEVEQILEDLWIRWYSAIFEEDETVLGEIVAVRPLYDAAVQAMGTAQFLAEPTSETVFITVHEILLDRPDCLVVHFERDLQGILGEGERFDGVQILWPTEAGTFRLARTWTNPSDLWQDDCDLMDRGEVP